MGRQLTIFWGYVQQYVKAKMAYRLDLLSSLVADLLQQVANLIFILVVFDNVPLLKDWTRNEILFIYGFFLIPQAIFYAIGASFFNFSERYVVNGELDRLLVRPVGTLFQMLCEGLELENLFGAVTGGIIVAVAGRQLGLVWDAGLLALFALLVAGAVLVYLGIFLCFVSIAFWADSRTGIMPLVWNLNHYGRYPVNIYQNVLRWILTTILPFAFVGAFPAAYFLGREQWTVYALLTPVVGAVVFLLGRTVWHAGVRRYHGVGS